jgi:hypothetical protein
MAPGMLGGRVYRASATQSQQLACLLEFLIAMIAAMKNVLSPISDDMITSHDLAKPVKNSPLIAGKVDAMISLNIQFLKGCVCVGCPNLEMSDAVS